MTKNQMALCAVIKRLGYSQNMQVKLYGQVFDLISDPVAISEDVIIVDGRDHKSGMVSRVRIPRPVMQMAKQSRAA